MSSFKLSKLVLVVLFAGVIFTGCVHKKYETPIAKNTQQPDKVLFDSAMKDIEHGRYEVARISLQTLMNTYDSSEYMAKAKLAIADSWFREGGPNGLAQAEAEYKDFILFYPGMEESAQAQKRICDIHYDQMDKSDRDVVQTIRAEDECKALIVQFPNSKFVPAATQELRNIQESLAAHEFAVGDFYHSRQMNPAAANRLSALVDQYPLYSKAGDALYEAGDSYSKMGPRFRKEAGEEFARIISDYPLSDKVKEATRRLNEMELPIPPVSQAALERAKWEKENYKSPSMLSKSMGILKGGPDVAHAARSGAPTMTDPKRTYPKSIPMVNNDAAPANGGAATTDVSVSNATGSALDTKPDARTAAGTTAAGANADGSTKITPTQQPTGPLPTNRDAEIKKYRAAQAKKQEKLAKKRKKNNETAAPASTTPASTTPAGTNPAAAGTTPNAPSTPAPQTSQR